MNKNLFLLCLIFINYSSYSQKIEIGEVKKIQSSFLNEAREYWVSLPKHYEDPNYPDQDYPVIYLLDGEKFFNVVSGIAQNLANDYYPNMPEAIVIGIVNTNRSRDLTPTHDATLQYNSGGGDTFREFISKELIPKINADYRVTPLKVLIGHSFGGLFTMNTVYKTPDLFNRYIAIDPSTWWDNMLIINQTDRILKAKIYSSNYLYVADAEPTLTHIELDQQLNKHEAALHLFSEKIKDKKVKGLQIKYEPYPNEDHGSVFLPALIDGLKMIFNGYKINAKEVVKDPLIMENRYTKLSKKFGIPIVPQSFYISNLIDLALKTEEKENAELLYKVIAEHYPNNIFIKTKFIKGNKE